MKVTRNWGALAAALLGAALFAANAEAGGAFAGGSDCATQDKGDRLEGVVHVSFEQAVNGDPSLCQQAADVDVTIRLENKTLRQTFYGVVHVGLLEEEPRSDVCNPCRIMDVLLTDETAGGVRAQILDAFYPGQTGRTLGVRELNQLSINSEEFSDDEGPKVRYRSLSNVVVTVQ